MKCKIEGKYYNLIIDGGSYENLVPIEVVNKLNIKGTPHLEAYRCHGCKMGKESL